MAIYRKKKSDFKEKKYISPLFWGDFSLINVL